jgi:hypothetical protein
MRFDRGLRRAMPRPYPVGYAAMPTDGFNGEKAHCRFGGVKDAGVWLTEKVLPSIIELKVRLMSIWVDNVTAYAQLGESAPCALYPDKAAFSKVSVEFLGTGQYQKKSGEETVPFTGTHFLGYHLILPQPFLYRKNFKVQPEGRLIHQKQGGGTCLWAYGAQQVEDDIHPFVVALDSMRNETFLRASSLLYWREQGIHPSEKERIFQEAFEEDEVRTFFESIEAGMSLIHLAVGLDEKGQPVSVPYRSYRLSKNFIFYKKEEK